MTAHQKQIANLVEKIRPLLAGHAPDVQGAVLADLMAIWLCGHPPQMRPLILELQLQTIIPLIQANDHLIFGPQGHPSVSHNN